MDRRGHILFVDAFDSFANNIVGLLEKSLHVQVTVVRIDDEDVAGDLNTVLKSFDAVVVGPGPGHPSIPTDVGLINKLWALQNADILPILGICLGFQSLALAHGADVTRLERPRHGIVSKVSHNGSDIFENLGDLHATQYHSLRVDISKDCHIDCSSPSVYWQPTEACPSLRPLAWDVNDDVNGPILMALQHTEKPFWGVQFHPESICTSKEGARMIQNWWRLANAWSFSERRNEARIQFLGITLNDTNSSHGLDTTKNCTHPVSHLAQELQSIIGTREPLLRWAKHPAERVSPVDLCEVLGMHRDEIVMLDSQGHKSGRFSILGIVIPGKTMKLTYNAWNRTLRYGFRISEEFVMNLDSIDQVWPILQEALDLHDPSRQQGRSHTSNESGGAYRTGLDCSIAGSRPLECPFWGGFMGYISYEAGLESIQVELHESCAYSRVPDLNFAFIHRSIVIDHATNQIYVQSLLPDDWTWILDVGMAIDGLISRLKLNSTRVSQPLTSITKEAFERSAAEHAGLETRLRLARIEKPDESQYRAKVLDCQKALSAGDSYELCLTDETEIRIPRLDYKPLNPWSLYKKLRRKNPAPFGSFLRLSNAVVVGSSPERFLNWDRSGHCEFRPIKGTVKKSAEMTKEQAHKILNSSKEQAENLMIVDLIRHDLSGVIGAANCTVSKLMVIEEYETVYQLVSVIEGQLPSDTSDYDSPRGLDVLKASLPPGSMTGAPKKRSCELLRDIEQRPRGIYSGVLGYMDIGGGGDFSVVIRSAVHGPTCSADRSADDTWFIGAGGAVTIQSTDEAEFLEMEVKAMSALTTFQPERE
ncbi:hypothetical protein V499_00043 [Pseudogymnoascus sp. VKM F-103]|nr:hypothetical protein V499_00043 [Pseudogymnoascus sp. VKM F-103]